MKAIDRLLKKAVEIHTKIMAVIYPDNDDGFLEALGFDPKEFEKTLASGEVVYEFEITDLLSRVAEEVWKDYKEGDD